MNIFIGQILLTLIHILAVCCNIYLVAIACVEDSIFGIIFWFVILIFNILALHATIIDLIAAYNINRRLK